MGWPDRVAAAIVEGLRFPQAYVTRLQVALMEQAWDARGPIGWAELSPWYRSPPVDFSPAVDCRDGS